MQSKNNSNSFQSSLNQLPKQIQNQSQAEFSFGFAISTSSIVDLFEEIAKNLDFQMIERELTYSTAIKQVKKSFLQYLDCFNWVSDGNMTAIKLTLYTSEKNSLRICKIRGLIGSKKEVKHFIDTFKIKSEIMIKQQPFHIQQNQEMLEEPQNPFHLQACAAYMFHKILSNQKYGIGNILSRSIKDYINSYSDVQNSKLLLPLPMKSIVVTIKEIVDVLYKDFNLGRKQMEKIMPYCRISVQKYVFDKIQNVMLSIYTHKNSLENTIFEQKRAKIFSQKKLKDILSDIQLERGNWLFEENNQQKINAKIEEIITKKELRTLTKYKKACEEFQKMTHVSNPRQKMKHCQIAYSVLKTLVYEGSNKKNELSNMQDIIPVLIFVILLSQIPEVKSQFDIILDFIQFDNCDLESERRLMLNLSESFNFIYRDWSF